MKIPRSFLFVPGDSARKMVRGAHALTLDLEDSVAAERQVEARQMVREYLLVWNALKQVSSVCSAAEQSALFHGNAQRVYNIN